MVTRSRPLTHLASSQPATFDTTRMPEVSFKTRTEASHSKTKATESAIQTSTSIEHEPSTVQAQKSRVNEIITRSDTNAGKNFQSRIASHPCLTTPTTRAKESTRQHLNSNRLGLSNLHCTLYNEQEI